MKPKTKDKREIKCLEFALEFVDTWPLFSWVETLILSASPIDVITAIDVVTAIEPPNELQSDFQVVWPEEPTRYYHVWYNIISRNNYFCTNKKWLFLGVFLLFGVRNNKYMTSQSSWHGCLMFWCLKNLQKDLQSVAPSTINFWI